MMNETENKKQEWVSPCYCINLRRAANRITDYYDRELDQHGITINQYCILANLGRMDGCCIGDLARAVHLEKSTLVRNLQPLFKRELIENTALPHERSCQLHLTACGKEIVVQAKPAWEKAQQSIKEKLGDAEVKKLMDLLTGLS